MFKYTKDFLFVRLILDKKKTASKSLDPWCCFCVYGLVNKALLMFHIFVHRNKQERSVRILLMRMRNVVNNWNAKFIFLSSFHPRSTWTFCILNNGGIPFLHVIVGQLEKLKLFYIFLRWKCWKRWKKLFHFKILLISMT